jgi:two-component system CheB/CheR fusion protein
MPELLQRFTGMKVTQVTDRQKVKPNCVYVIPPNKSMSILNGTLYLFDPIETRGLRLPIDYFFRSLAQDKHDKSVGIILSGMGSDGSLGLKAIKEKNGAVLVQEPTNAKFESMPRSAIEAVIADIIAPADMLALKLIELLKYIPNNNLADDVENKNKSNLDKIIILLREQTGHDFSMYKKNTLFRRIERRKGVHQIDRLEKYVRFLQENPQEVEILFKELLIGVTSFFRDASVWEKLKNEVLPEMMTNVPDGTIMRAWVPGCSTGEEAYSLAIILKETLEQLNKHKHISFQIFASDLDSDAIDIARKGLYPKNIISDVSPERIQRFFSEEAGCYKISNSIRELVVFAPQNVIKDPPFTKLDILSCRNMLIYIEPELQKKIIALFHYSLNPGGVMILGTAESLGNLHTGFEELDGRLKLFKRNTISMSSELIDFPSSFHRPKTAFKENDANTKSVENIQELANEILLQHFAPPSVLVNNKGDILYITGRIGNYLELVAGKANLNIHVMAREGLRQELPSAFRKAMQSFDPVILENIKIGSNGTIITANITIRRIEHPEAIKGMIIIVFHELPKVVKDENNQKDSKTNSRGRNKEIEFELQRSYEDLQSTREEMQTSQEELKSTNEELQSTNEELQSTNEELTTSKEEMQSLNEELQTVNAELQTRVSDFMQASSDMKNLLNSTEIATLFLDKDLNIRRFTDSTTNIFKLRNADVGRPFTDLVSDLQYPDIDKHARQVIKTLTTIENPTITKDGRWYNVRIMPYRTLDDRIDGLVITFMDITVSKKLETELKEANEALRNRV